MLLVLFLIVILFQVFGLGLVVVVGGVARLFDAQIRTELFIK